MMIVNLVALVEFSLVLLSIFYLNSPLAVALSELLVLLIFFPIISKKLETLIGLKTFNISKYNFEIIRKSLSPSFHFFGLQLSNLISIQGPIIILSMTSGPILVSVFSSLRTLANIISRFIGLLSHSAWPELTKLYSKSDYDSLFKVFQLILLISIFVGFAFQLFCALFGERLYSLWIHDQLEYDAVLMYILCSYASLSATLTWASNLLMAINNHILFTRINIIANILSLLILYVGIKHFHYNNSILLMLLTQYILNLFGVYISMYSNNSIRIQAKAVVLYSLFTFAIVAIIGIYIFIINNY